MELVTAKEMRRLDLHAIQELGLSALVLMENAGRALAEAVLVYAAGRPLAEADGVVLPGSDRGGRGASANEAAGRCRTWFILVGKGNNGGDGLVAARHLMERDVPVRLIYAADPGQLRGEAAVQRDIAARHGIAAQVYRPGMIDWQGAFGIVDALLGTGTSGEPREPYASLIREANASGLPIVAADIPSGLDADTGAAADPCIRAAATVTFAFAKRGLAQFPGAAHAGTVIVAPIGIPRQLADAHGVRTRMLTPESLRARLGADPELKRESDSHKGTYGHVLVAAGSRTMTGAGWLSSAAALRAGSGLVTWAVPDRMLEPLVGSQPELMLAGLPDGGTGDWSAVDPGALAELAAKRDVLVIGPGFGRVPQADEPGGRGWLRRLWDTLPPALPLVVDADALNHMAEAGDFAAWPKRPGAVVLTPHPGEMARLAGIETRDVQRDRIGVASTYARQHGVVLVLKGARTVVALPTGEVYVNPTGNPGMSTGGTGDVLSGIIGGLLAQRLPAPAAAALGVYLHGDAGDRAAARRRSAASLIAGDLLQEL